VQNDDVPNILWLSVFFCDGERAYLRQQPKYPLFLSQNGGK